MQSILPFGVPCYCLPFLLIPGQTVAERGNSFTDTVLFFTLQGKPGGTQDEPPTRKWVWGSTGLAEDIFNAQRKGSMRNSRACLRKTAESNHFCFRQKSIAFPRVTSWRHQWLTSLSHRGSHQPARTSCPRLPALLSAIATFTLILGTAWFPLSSLQALKWKIYFAPYEIKLNMLKPSG